MTKMTYATAIRRLTAEQRKLREVRDRLSALQDEIDGQLDDVNDADESLAYAIDALSRLV